jgi:hypothetical protein
MSAIKNSPTANDLQKHRPGWLRSKEFVREGFKGYSQLSEGFVAAKSYLMKNAMEGEMFDVTINPALVRVSFGDLRLPADITVTLKAGNILEFNWNPDFSGEDINQYDQAMLLIYDIEHEKVHQRKTGEFRKTGKMELELTTEKSGHTYHIYFAMAAHDRSRRSNSVYLGTVTTEILNRSIYDLR